MVSSFRRSIRHACIHRDHSSIDSFIVIILFYISYQVIMMVIIVYHHHYHCYLFFCFRQPRASTTFQWCFLLLLLYLYGNDDGLGSFKQVNRVRDSLSSFNYQSAWSFSFYQNKPQGPLEARLFVRFHLCALSKGRNFFLSLEHGEWSERRRWAQFEAGFIALHWFVSWL